MGLTAYAVPGLDGRFWAAHYPGRASPGAVTSVDAAGRWVQPYPVVGCSGLPGANGLLGR